MLHVATNVGKPSLNRHLICFEVFRPNTGGTALHGLGPLNVYTASLTSNALHRAFVPRGGYIIDVTKCIQAFHAHDFRERRYLIVQESFLT